MLSSAKNRMLGAVLLFASIAAMVLAVVNMPATLSVDDVSLWRYCCLFFVLTIASLLFLGWTRRNGGFHVSNLSTWLTIVVWVEFGLVPLICTCIDLEDLDPTLVQAEAYVLLGMLAFWLGAIRFTRRSEETRFVQVYAKRSNQRLYWGVALLIVGTLAKFYLLVNGLFSYVADAAKLMESAPYLQWVLLLSSFSFLSLVVLAIEAFRPHSPLVFKIYLGINVVLSLMFGVLSGMKEDILFIPLIACIVYRLVNPKFPWKYAVIGAVLFASMFPLNAYYRQQITREGPVSSLKGGEAALAESVRTASENRSEYVDDATESILYRLDLLSTLHFLIDDQGRSNLKGKEELWMLPIYGFVPRFLWHDKPILNKGQRLTYAMTGFENSSTAVTPFGDLYILAGLPGILLGMVAVGAIFQRFSNLVTGIYDAKMIFIYVILFKVCYKPEWDMFDYVSLLIQQSIVAFGMAYLIYGGRVLSTSSAGRARLEAIFRGSVSYLPMGPRRILPARFRVSA